jgi:hypothetical protein
MMAVFSSIDCDTSFSHALEENLFYDNTIRYFNRIQINKPQLYSYIYCRNKANHALRNILITYKYS